MPKCPHSKSDCPHYQPRKRNTVTNPDISTFIDFYHAEYQVKFGSSPIFCGGKDAMIVKRLLSRWPLISLKIHLPEYLSDEKPFYQENGYDLTRFERYLAGQTVKKAKDNGRWRGPFEALTKALDAHYDGKPLAVLNDDARRVVFKIGKDRIMSLYSQGREQLQEAFKSAF